MVPHGCIVCDVGCDHGYVPIYLAEHKICPKIIAMDVNEGPLMQAKEHIRAFALEEYIETRRSDGVGALGYEEADCLILAGMGGRLTVRILTEGKEKIAAIKVLVLQPQSEITLVRAFLRERGYRIIHENMVYEDGKFYPMMKAVLCPADQDCEKEQGHLSMPDRVSAHLSEERTKDMEKSALLQQAYDRYGPCLLQSRHPVLYQFIRWEQEREAAISRRIESGAGRDDGARRRRLEELALSARIRDVALSFYAHGQT